MSDKLSLSDVKEEVSLKQRHVRLTDNWCLGELRILKEPGNWHQIFKSHCDHFTLFLGKPIKILNSGNFFNTYYPNRVLLYGFPAH